MPDTLDPSLLFLDRPAPVRTGFFTLKDSARLRYAVAAPAESARGTFLIAPGRREFIEKKYIEMANELLARRFKLIFFEWRGQGLSSRVLTGAKAQRDHSANFGGHLDDLRAFYKDVVARETTGPLYAFGHSMGAFLTLRWLADDRPAVKAAIVTSPMLALPVPSYARQASALAMRLGFGRHYAYRNVDYGANDTRFADNLLSHDPARFAVMEKYFALHPEMIVGGVTWGWLHEALESIEIAHRPSYLARIAVPVLMLTGGADIVTPAVQFRSLLAGTNVEEHSIPGAWHDLMNEADEFRRPAWNYIDRFLARVAP